MKKIYVRPIVLRFMSESEQLRIKREFDERIKNVPPEGWWY